MKLFLKLLFPVIFFVTTLTFVYKVSADVIIPDCQWNQTKTSCIKEYRNENITISSDDCLKYKNNPGYHFLWEYNYVSDVASVKSEYCKQASILELMNKYKYFVGIPLLVTIIIEVIVYFIRDYKKIKELLNVVLVNCISLPGGYLLYPVIQNFYRRIIEPILPISYDRLLRSNVEIFTSFMIIEILVIIFEILFLICVTRFEDKRKTAITVIIANIISAVLGSLIITVLYSFLSISIL